MGALLKNDDITAVIIEDIIVSQVEDQNGKEKKKLSEHPNVWDEIPLFTFPVPIKPVIAHLVQDMRDDWFPDPLRYLDILNHTDDIHKVVNALLEENNGIYNASPRDICDVPKKGKILRIFG